MTGGWHSQTAVLTMEGIWRHCYYNRTWKQREYHYKQPTSV